MKEQNRNGAVESSQVCYETLEHRARMKVQAFLQEVLEEEVTAFLGRKKHDRREGVSLIDPPKGSRNGYGRPRRFAMMSGTVTVRRPRVRDLEERFVSPATGGIQAPQPSRGRSAARALPARLVYGRFRTGPAGFAGGWRVTPTA
jgi:hypothetical protein